MSGESGKKKRQRNLDNVGEDICKFGRKKKRSTLPSMEPLRKNLSSAGWKSRAVTKSVCLHKQSQGSRETTFRLVGASGKGQGGGGVGLGDLKGRGGENDFCLVNSSRATQTLTSNVVTMTA